jgi:hypothetical protein
VSARALGAGILFVSAIFVVSGCDHFDGGRTTETDDVRPIVDEQRGRYGDVRLGSSEADVRATFGEPGGGDGFFPLEAESYRGPVSIASLVEGSRSCCGTSVSHSLSRLAVASSRCR